MPQNAYGPGGSGDVIAVGFDAIRLAAEHLKAMMNTVYAEHEELLKGISPLRQVWVAEGNSDAANLYDASTKRLETAETDLAQTIGQFSTKADSAASMQTATEKHNTNLFT